MDVEHNILGSVECNGGANMVVKTIYYSSAKNTIMNTKNTPNIE